MTREHGAAVRLFKATEPDAALPLLKRLRAALDAYFDYVEAHEHGYRAVYRGEPGTDHTSRAAFEEHRERQAGRIIDALEAEGLTGEALAIAVRGWLAFLVNAVLDWLERGRPLERSALQELCVRTLTSAVTHAITADKGRPR
ncbi:hypothetical protein ACFXJ5_17555 [Streptomyces sp. NPDC059373]